MDELISRQAAIDTLENTKTAISENGERYIAKQNAIMRIDALPSAQPEPSQVARDISRIIENEKDMRVIAQPEIIRCKDCKNWDTTWTNDFSPNYHYCPMVDGVRKEDWYCADAERRTE